MSRLLTDSGNVSVLRRLRRLT